MDLRKSFGLVCVVAIAMASMARAQDDPKAIVEKAIKARGGAEKLTKYPAATWKGTGSVSAMGQELNFTGDWAVQAPNKVKMNLDFNGQFKFVQVSDGKQGWRDIGGMVTDLSPEEVAEISEGQYAEALMARLVQLQGKDFTLTAAGEKQVEGKPAAGIKVSSKGHRDVTLYFDKGSGLPVAVEMKTKDFMQGGQEIKQESIILEYKDVQGLKYPGKIKIVRDGMKFVESDMTDIKLLEKLDDNTFKKPA